jgi:hypothetical protein
MVFLLLPSSIIISSTIEILNEFVFGQSDINQFWSPFAIRKMT